MISSLLENPTVLEVGCGTGGLALALARRGFEVWGVDVNQDMLAIAEAAGVPTLKLVRGKAEQFDVKQSFDLIVLSSHLFNLSDTVTRSAMLRTMIRHLATGGLLALEVANPEWWTSQQNLDGQAVALANHRYDNELNEWTAQTISYGVHLSFVDYDDVSQVWSGEAEYRFGDVTYSHSLETQIIPVEDINNQMRNYQLIPAQPPAAINETDLLLLYRMNGDLALTDFSGAR